MSSAPRSVAECDQSGGLAPGEGAGGEAGATGTGGGIGSLMSGLLLPASGTG